VFTCNFIRIVHHDLKSDSIVLLLYWTIGVLFDKTQKVKQQLDGKFSKDWNFINHDGDETLKAIAFVRNKYIQFPFYGWQLHVFPCDCNSSLYQFF